MLTSPAFPQKTWPENRQPRNQVEERVAHHVGQDQEEELCGSGGTDGEAAGGEGGTFGDVEGGQEGQEAWCGGREGWREEEGLRMWEHG